MKTHPLDARDRPTGGIDEEPRDRYWLTLTAQEQTAYRRLWRTLWPVLAVAALVCATIIWRG